MRKLQTNDLLEHLDEDQCIVLYRYILSISDPKAYMRTRGLLFYKYNHSKNFLTWKLINNLNNNIRITWLNISK